MRILIAEDDALSRTILKKAVEKFGHECLAAKDGIEAWGIFQTSDVDVIISDWMMPGIDGMELCRRVREQSQSSYTYFIFLTALGDKEHFLAGMEMGADDYLIKPLDLLDLKVRLIAASRVTSLHQQLAEQKAELEQLSLKFFEQARKDQLTQIGNRLQLQEDLEALCGRVKRYGHAYCAALCDIDYFKLYNDTYGHLAGDEVLRLVADTIARGFRKGDSVYRYGGEEFLIILPEQSLESATIAINRVRKDVENLAIPHCGNKESGVVTISAGIAALHPGEDKTPEELLREADAALYQAKQAGRNRVAIYSLESNLCCLPDAV